MKILKKSVLSVSLLIAGVALVASCDDANEYGDVNTDNPSWMENYNDSTPVAHPESVANTVWKRSSGLKTNAFGEEVQGFVESLAFDNDSVVVKMSQGLTAGTWTDDSNTPAVPKYEYVYSSTTGNVEILRRTVDDNGKVSKTTIFNAVVVNGKQNIMTVIHYGDTPIQTYLTKQ